MQVLNKKNMELEPELKLQDEPKQELKDEPKLLEYYKQTVEFYEHIADCYNLIYPDHIKESKRLFMELEQLFKEKGIRTALDAACGIGYDMSLLCEMDIEVSGIDISQSMVSKTISNFKNSYEISPIVKQLDVRLLTESIFDNKFDLVVFRGNTFSNILPNEIPLVLENLLSVVSDDGILLIDYRDGNEQILENKQFELRGLFCDKDKGQLLDSYYFITHSKKLNIPYNVEANVNLLLFNETKEKIKKKWSIKSHYVDPNIINNYLKKIGTPYQYVKNVEGLPYLRTIIITK